MISLRSIKWFCIMNGFLMSGAWIQYWVYTEFHSILNLFLTTFAKTCIVTSAMNTISKSIPNTSIRIESIRCFVSSACIESIAFYIMWMNANQTTAILHEMIWFIPISFTFEIVFDFFHYCMHRISHTYRPLFKHFHAIHHSQHKINVLTTFHHHPIDLIITNTIPLLLTSRIVPLNTFTLTAIFWYKTWIELGGHVGKDVRSPSFPQCIWMPQILGMELNARDHEMHHIQPNCNFSKRFSLWDRLFGTFAEHRSNQKQSIS
jgi:sterol desaturase/sphingolipid hydroxylase (fatty acid hydroxylase superfamily)